MHARAPSPASSTLLPWTIDWTKDGGLLLVYSEEITPRFGITVGSGMWWFQNRTKGIDPSGAMYEQRAITLPLMLGASVTAFRASRVNLYVDLNGGLAYTQYIEELDAGGLHVQPRTEAIHGVGLVLWVGLHRLSGPGHLIGPRFGSSFFNIGGQSVHSLYGTSW